MTLQDEAGRVLFHTIREQVLTLSLCGSPSKDDLDEILLQMRLFSFTPDFGGAVAPSAVPTLWFLHIFSLRVLGYLRQVWLQVDPGELQPPRLPFVTIKFHRDRLHADQGVCHALREWGRPVEIHRHEFRMVTRDLKTLTLGETWDVPSWAPPKRKRPNAEFADLTRPRLPKSKISTTSNTRTPTNMLSYWR